MCVCVGLADVVGAMKLARHGHHHALLRHERIGGGGNRISQVLGAVIRVLRRRAHRADHHDRLGRQGQEIPRERGLLDDVCALHDDHTVDLGLRQAIGDEAADLEHVLERQVRGGHQAPVDRLDLGDLGQARDGGEQLIAAHCRQVAARAGIVPHRDGAAGEHDGDARHRESMPPGSRRGNPVGCS